VGWTSTANGRSRPMKGSVSGHYFASGVLTSVSGSASTVVYRCVEFRGETMRRPPSRRLDIRIGLCDLRLSGPLSTTDDERGW
jgi:hypothetical protein